MRNNLGSILALVGASVVTIAMLAAVGAFAADAPKAIGMTSAGGNKGFGLTAPAQPCPTGETATTDATTGKQQCAARAGVMPNVGGLRNGGAAAATTGNMAVPPPAVAGNPGKNISDGAAKGQASE